MADETATQNSNPKGLDYNPNSCKGTVTHHRDIEKYFESQM
jgi:hypothetical protein